MKIVLQNLTKIFPSRNKKSGEEVVAVNNFDFTIPDGKLIGLLGPSGCGKSTTLYMISGLQKPSSGKIFFGEDDVTDLSTENRGIGLVFQNYALYPHMTVLQNICFPMEIRKIPKKERLAQADEFLEKVALAGLGHRFPKELSGGQQQRVAIARALAQDSEVLLMDEPFGAIDARNRSVLQDLLLDLWEKGDGQERKTVVFVTHDLEEAILLSDRIIMMQANPGRIQAEFRVPLPRPRRRLELLNNPAYVDFRTRLSKVFFADEAQEVNRA